MPSRYLAICWNTCNLLPLLIYDYHTYYYTIIIIQELAPHTSPIFVSAFRLLPAGVALVAWAAASGRKQPQGWQAWLACALFGLVDGTAFQVLSLFFASAVRACRTVVCYSLSAWRFL